jgi:hypothetical protein
MQSGSRFLFKALFVSSTGLAAAVIGMACIVLINLAPTAILGDGILIVSPYITGIPSLVAAFFVARWCFIHHMEWLDAGFPASQPSPSTPQLISSVITLAGGLAALYIAVNGLYPKSFELVWREEIRLGNGGLKVVETRRTYERLDFLRLNEFQNVRLQSTQLSFEPAVGEPRVSVTTQLQPVYLNQIDGVWYLVLAGRKGDPHGEQPKDDWGDSYNTLGQRLAILNGRAFEPAPWEKAPRPIVFFNLLSTDIFDLAKAKAAENHLVTLYEKQTLAYRYVNTPGPDPLRITRSEAMKTPLLEEYQEALAGLIKPP